ncbi:cold shock and DUF1294 domain-containing protein [Simiduia litorea]|uniref:DUF1294 domain-containing protein n=1 Tax=Simiduia litorea TaxID=1435348 RepID=UPI0036F1A7FB
MKHTGKLISWNLDKGFGFVEPKYGGRDIFVHISDFIDTTHSPEVGQTVNFSLATDSAGRTCGKKVRREHDRLPAAHSHLSGNISVVLAILFTLVVSYSVLSLRMPAVLLWYYLAINSLTFIWYLSDKAAAQKGQWRIKESRLHLMALLGGWPGATFAQQIFRHKSKKLSFRMVYWLTILLNILGFYWLQTPDGQILLLTLLSV